MAAGENLLLKRLRNSAGLNEEVKHIVGTNPKRDSAMCSDSDLQQKFCNERKHSTRMSSEFVKGTRYLKSNHWVVHMQWWEKFVEFNYCHWMIAGDIGCYFTKISSSDLEGQCLCNMLVKNLFKKNSSEFEVPSVQRCFSKTGCSQSVFEWQLPAWGHSPVCPARPLTLASHFPPRDIHSFCDHST